MRSRAILSWLQYFLPEKAKYFGIRLFHFAILNGHLHLLLLAKDKAALSGFLRVIAGVIARKVLKAEKGSPKGIKMWMARPYSRVLSWGREFSHVLSYIERNVLEGAKRITYVARHTPLLPKIREEISRNLTLSRWDSLSRQPLLPF